MLVSYETFSLFVIFAIFVSLTGAIILMMVLAFERHISGLSYEKQKIILEKTLQESQYMQLNQQIHPHFLFNTINLMLGLARLKRIETLISTMETLSLFLKFKYQVKDPLIPLEKEWEYTKYYLKIQQIRFRDRLTIEEEMAANTFQTLVPPYLMQTLVENAFKHGLEKKPGPLKLVLKAEDVTDSILLQIADNGLGLNGLTMEQLLNKGHGLANVHQRLKLLYEDSKLDIRENHDQGVIVTVTIPKMVPDTKKGG
jgi:two-component system sensor histidine kinase AlgZ